MERNNLSSDPRYVHLSNELEFRLLKWMKRTDDPLMQEGEPQLPDPTLQALRDATHTSQGTRPING